MASYAYPIERTHDGSTFLIQPYSIDGPSSPFTTALYTDSVRSATSANTSLILFGKGVPEYGEFLQQNVVNLLQNFANPSAPVYPSVGQLWFNSTASILSVYDGLNWLTVSDPNSGNSLGDLSDVTLTTPTTSDFLTYNGTEWVNLNYSKLVDINALTPSNNAVLVFDGTWTSKSPSQYRTLLDVLSTTESNDTFVNIVGDTMQGDLSMGNYLLRNLGSPLAGTDAANKTYVDNANAFQFGDDYNFQHQANVQNTVEGLTRLDRLNYNDGIIDRFTYTYVSETSNDWTFLFDQTNATVTLSKTAPLFLKAPYHYTQTSDLRVEIEGKILTQTVPASATVSLKPVTTAYQVLRFQPSVTSSTATGLTSSTPYFFTVHTSDSVTTLSVTLSASSTYNDLISALNTALSAYGATASIVSGNIQISKTGVLFDTVLLTRPAPGVLDLFASLAAFSRFDDHRDPSAVYSDTPTGLLGGTTYTLSIAYKDATGADFTDSISFLGSTSLTYSDLINTLNQKLRGAYASFVNNRIVLKLIDLQWELQNVTGTAFSSLTLFNSTTVVPKVQGQYSSPARTRLSSVAIVDNLYIKYLVNAGELAPGDQVVIRTRGVQ